MTTYTSEYPPSHNSTYVKATSCLSPGDYDEFFATDPAKSLTGSMANNGWIASGATNTRFHIDLGSAKIIRRIYYENYIESGATYNRGSNTVTFWGSNDATAFGTLTYGTDTNWTQITIADANFTKHVELDQADPKYSLATNTTAYRYYALKIADTFGGGYIGIRRLVMQTEDGYTPPSPSGTTTVARGGSGFGGLNVMVIE